MLIRHRLVTVGVEGVIVQQQEHLCKSRFFKLDHIAFMVLFLTQKSSVHNCFVDAHTHKANRRTSLWMSLQRKLNHEGKSGHIMQGFDEGFHVTFHFPVFPYDVIS